MFNHRFSLKWNSNFDVLETISDTNLYSIIFCVILVLIAKFKMLLFSYNCSKYISSAPFVLLRFNHLNKL